MKQLEDTNPMSWDEYAGLVQGLVRDVQAYVAERGEQIDVIAPLLRSGGMVGSMMGVQMRVIPQLPLQFKYAYGPMEINQVIAVPQLLVDLPEEMNILLCDGNTSSGSMAMRAAQEVRKVYPKARLYLATVAQAYDCPKPLEGIEHVFYGVLSDERKSADAQDVAALGLRQGITVFPWEHAEDELADINAM